MEQPDVTMIFKETSLNFHSVMEQRNMVLPRVGGFLALISSFLVVLINHEGFIPQDSLHFCQIII